jgi:hypothetical protein
LKQKFLLEEEVVNKIIQKYIYDEKLEDSVVITGYSTMTHLAFQKEIRTDFYAKMSNVFRRHLHSRNPLLLLEALKCLFKLISDTSIYQIDFIIFPSVLEALKFSQEEILIVALKVLVIFCARHPMTFLEQLAARTGLDKILDLFFNQNTSYPVLRGVLDLLIVNSSNTTFNTLMLEKGDMHFIQRLVFYFLKF